jgi:polyketide biosynthesis enoyl-CoA hydratase PksH
VTYETIKTRFQETVCFLEIDRPEANNTINGQLIEDCGHALAACEERANVVVLSGTPEVFCFGAEFADIRTDGSSGEHAALTAALYEVWVKLATGPYVTIAQVRGKANAGGIGFVAACDIVLADETARFSLSELLFGVYPACVLPFLMRRVGFQKAHYLTLVTQPIGVEQAHSWGLVDAYEAQCELLVRRHLLRLRRLSKAAIRRYKTYVNDLHGPLQAAKSAALAGNLDVFSDPVNLAGIGRYVQTGLFPWEG